jgi:hypothetical protein
MNTPTETTSPGPLDYGATAAQLAQDLGVLQEYAARIGLDKSIRLIDEVLARMREHRFTVAIVGEFKTGKSTFVNALLGVDVVPTDVVPATATLNRMTYGLESSIEVIYKDGRKEAVEFDKLKEYVTKEFVTSEMLDAVDEVVVRHPAPYLLNNVDIIDTPGLNDESSMTGVTLSVLPRIDAAILVISALVPFSEYTREFLEERLLSSDLGRVLFVVNRIGQVGSTEKADRIVEHIEDRIRRHVLDRAERELGEGSPEYEAYVRKIGKPRVFGIDAFDALQAIVTNDSARLQRSRFVPFQNGLRRFLNEDRGAIVLEVPANRVLASANEILMALDLRRRTAGMSGEDFAAKRAAADQELQRLRARKEDDLREAERQQADATNRALAVIAGLDDRVKSAVRQALSELEFTATEKSSTEEATRKVHSVVNTTIRRVTEQDNDRVAAEINRSVAETSGQFQRLAADLQKTVENIHVSFTAAGETHAIKIGEVAVLGAAAWLVGGIPGLGGAVAGYREAGIAGALTGGVSSFAATMAGVMLAGAIGLPFTLPVYLGIVLASAFGGGKIAKAIFKPAAGKTINEQTIEQIVAQLAELHLEAEMTKSAREYAAATFERLAKMMSDEVDAVIENTRRTLADLALEKERQEILTQHQTQELDQMAERTRAIADRAAAIQTTLAARAEAAA